MRIQCAHCNESHRNEKEHLDHMKFRHFGIKSLRHICGVCNESLRQTSYVRHFQDSAKHKLVLNGAANISIRATVQISQQTHVPPYTLTQHRRPAANRQIQQNALQQFSSPSVLITATTVALDYDALQNSINQLKDSCENMWMDLLGKPKITSKLIDEVSKQHVKLIRTCMEIVKLKFLPTEYETFEAEMDSFLKQRQSQYMRMQMLRHNPHFLPPHPFVFTYRNQIVDNTLLVRNSNVAVVTLEKTLRHLLSNEKLCEVLNYPSMYYDSVDYDHPFAGRHTKNIYEKLGKQDCILIQLFMDEFCPVNPIGPATGRNKIMALYFKVLNIPYDMQVLDNIFLGFLALANDVKHSLQDLLRQLMLPQLQKLRQGVPTFFNGVKRNIPVILHSIVGDNLGVHQLQGLLQYFRGNSPCRFCTVIFDDFETTFSITPELLKTTATYDAAIASNDSEIMRKQGITEKCALNDAPLFHFMDSQICDIMHDLPEGHLRRLMASVITSLIVDEQISLERINNAIKTFPFSGSMRNNRPSPIVQQHINNGEIKGQTASMMINLTTMFPLILKLNNITVPASNGWWTTYRAFLKIWNMLMMPKINDDQINFLQILIEKYLQAFHLNGGHFTVKPHYMLHYPGLIRLFGPLCFHWCMRYEGKHKQFKDYAKVNSNFKDLTMTLAHRQQLMMVPSFSDMTDGNMSFVKVVYGQPSRPCFTRISAPSTSTDRPTILWLKNAVRSHFLRPYLECTAELRGPAELISVTRNETVKKTFIMEDSQPFFDTDDITINAIDRFDNLSKSDKLKRIGPECCLKFFHSKSLEEWSTKNAASIKTLYDFDDSKPLNDPLFPKLKLFEHFDANLLRAATMAVKYHEICPAQTCYEQALDVLLNALPSLGAKAFTNNQNLYSSKILIQHLHAWLKKDIILEWAVEGLKSPLHIKMNLQHLRRQPISASTYSSPYPCPSITTLSTEGIAAVSYSLKSSKTMEDAEYIYKTSTNIRFGWFNALRNDTTSTETMATVTIKQFPILQKNLRLLKYDYCQFMTSAYKKVPDVGESFAKYAESIIKLGSRFKLPYVDDNDITLSAGRMLPDLVNKYYNSTMSSFKHLLLSITTSLNISELMFKRKEIKPQKWLLEQPLLGLTICEGKKTYYVIVDEFALQIPSANFSDALQCLFEVYWVFDLQYDENNKQLLQFLEFLSDFSSTPTRSDVAFKNALDEINADPTLYKMPQAVPINQTTASEQNGVPILQQLEDLINTKLNNLPDNTGSSSTNSNSTRKRPSQPSATQSEEVQEKRIRLSDEPGDSVSTMKPQQHIATRSQNKAATTAIPEPQPRLVFKKMEQFSMHCSLRHPFNTIKPLSQATTGTVTNRPTQVFFNQGTSSFYDMKAMAQLRGTQIYKIPSTSSFVSTLAFGSNYIDAIFDFNIKVLGGKWLPTYLTAGKACMDFTITASNIKFLNQILQHRKEFRVFVSDVFLITLDGDFTTSVLSQILLAAKNCKIFNLRNVRILDEITLFQYMSLLPTNIAEIT
uniref:C2H2-type domain-containing protein n=1 Tax=Panagrolaimus sp. ES5 TaxID=591445 RepID=A0AC34GVC5_9BILA